MVARARQALVAHGTDESRRRRRYGRVAGVLFVVAALATLPAELISTIVALGHLRHHARRGVLRTHLPGAALGAAPELLAARHPNRGGFGDQRRNPGDGPGRRRAVRVGGRVRRLRVRVAGADCGASDVDRPVPVRTPPLRPGCAFEHDPSRAARVPHHRAGGRTGRLPARASGGSGGDAAPVRGRGDRHRRGNGRRSRNCRRRRTRRAERPAAPTRPSGAYPDETPTQGN